MERSISEGTTSPFRAVKIKMVCVLGNIITYPEETCISLGRVILTLPKCSVLRGNPLVEGSLRFAQ